jgi:hypothetical protein
MVSGPTLTAMLYEALTAIKQAAAAPALFLV